MGALSFGAASLLTSHNPYGSELYGLAQPPPQLACHNPYASELDRLAQPRFGVPPIIHMDLRYIVAHPAFWRSKIHIYMYNYIYISIYVYICIYIYIYVMGSIVWRGPNLASDNSFEFEFYRLAQPPFWRPIIHLDLRSIVWRSPCWRPSHNPYGF